MAQVKFFNKIATPLQTFIHMKAPRRDNKQDRQVTLLFRIGLNGNVIRSAPDFVQSAYQELKNGASKVELDKEIANMNCHVFSLPDKKRADMLLPRLNLANMVVKKVKSSKGDMSQVLTFESVYPWDKAIWEYLGDHFASDVFLKFDAAQASLIDIEDGDGEEEEDDSQGDLGIEEGEGEEQEEPVN